MNRRALLGLGSWLTAAALTVVAGTWAVSLIGADLTGQEVRVMTSGEVERVLAGASGGPVAQPPASPPPGAAVRSFSYPEGSLMAACKAGRASLFSWSPAQGYGVDEVEGGPAPIASIEFESDDHRIVVEVTCPYGTPSATIRPDDDHESD